MSGEFLSRWSRLKEDARRSESGPQPRRAKPSRRRCSRSLNSRRRSLRRCPRSRRSRPRATSPASFGAASRMRCATRRSARCGPSIRRSAISSAKPATTLMTGTRRAACRAPALSTQRTTSRPWSGEFSAILLPLRPPPKRKAHRIVRRLLPRQGMHRKLLRRSKRSLRRSEPDGCATLVPRRQPPTRRRIRLLHRSRNARKNPPLPLRHQGMAVRSQSRTCRNCLRRGHRFALCRHNKARTCPIG
jgi:hypothetical protein